jgi:hypothetical protein
VGRAVIAFLLALATGSTARHDFVDFNSAAAEIKPVCYCGSDNGGGVFRRHVQDSVAAGKPYPTDANTI